MESGLFLASLYLGAALVVVPLAVRAGVGSVLGYLAAGILLGPVFGLAGEAEDLQHISEIGVVMMLFLIGLELAPRSVWDMRHALLGLGGAQIVGTCLAITGVLVMWDQPWQVALVIGMVLSLSSTAIVLQTLTEKNLMRNKGGRSAFSILLAQDIAVIPMLALIPVLLVPGAISSTPTEAPAEGAAEPLISLVQSLPGWGAAVLTLAIVAAIIFAGHFLSRPVFRFVHASRLPEMSTCMSLLMVLGIAFLMMLVGLSPALGTFVAGVVLANSEFRHQIEADLRPFKGLLLGLFFMTVGVGIDFQAFAAAPLLIIGATFGMIAIKAVILFGLGTVHGLRGRDRWLLALGLAQAGEFGFLLVSFARSEGVLPGALGQATLLVISLSMLLSPFLFVIYERLAHRLSETVRSAEPDTIDRKGRVIIAGIGRFGQVVNRLVRSSGVETVVLDADIGIIETMRRFGVQGFYGDPTRPEMLAAAGLAEAEVLVVTVNDRESALAIVRHARRERSDLHIVARARDRVHVYELFQAGANDIVRETFDSSIRAGRYVLENTGFNEYEASRMSQTFYRVDRAAMRDLAELWEPGQPVHLNEAYVARAKQLDRDLETALIDDLDEVRPNSAAAE